MATNYPSSLDTTTQLPNVTNSQDFDSAGFFHDVIHLNVNQAAIALETKLGTGASNAASAAAGSRLVANGSGGSSWRQHEVGRGSTSSNVGPTSGTSPLTICTTGDITTVAGRTYLLTGRIYLSQTVATDRWIAEYYYSSNNFSSQTFVGYGNINVNGTTLGCMFPLLPVEHTPGAGTFKYRLLLSRNSGTGTLTCVANTAWPTFFAVQDAGISA